MGRLNVLFGQVAVDLGYLTNSQLRHCVRLQQQAPSHTPLGEVCREQGLLDAIALRRILEEQRDRLTSSRLRRPRLGHSRRTIRREGPARSHDQPLTAKTFKGGSADVPPGARPPRVPVEPALERVQVQGASEEDPGTGPQLAIATSPSGVWGPFEIKSVLGRGGMGAVYLARNLMLRRMVAVKVPFESTCRVEDQARFLTEARSAACLDHPNVIRIYSVGEVDGRPYLEMEYAPGRALDQLMAEGPIEPWKAIEIFIRVCRGVSAAHAKGVIHRDLKPENILCCEDGRVLVTDFGLASNTRGTLSPEDGQVLMGTAGFIAPELLKGQAPDERSDLYSLGALLFNILTRRMPFSGNLPMQIFVAQISRPAPPLLSVNPDLPPWLEGIIARLLARDPQIRYQTVEELLERMNRK